MHTRDGRDSDSDREIGGKGGREGYIKRGVVWFGWVETRTDCDLRLGL